MLSLHPMLRLALLIPTTCLFLGCKPPPGDAELKQALIHAKQGMWAAATEAAAKAESLGADLGEYRKVRATEEWRIRGESMPVDELEQFVLLYKAAAPPAAHEQLARAKARHEAAAGHLATAEVMLGSKRFADAQKEAELAEGFGADVTGFRRALASAEWQALTRKRDRATVVSFVNKHGQFAPDIARLLYQAAAGPNRFGYGLSPLDTLASLGSVVATDRCIHHSSSFKLSKKCLLRVGGGEWAKFGLDSHVWGHFVQLDGDWMLFGHSSTREGNPSRVDAIEAAVLEILPEQAGCTRLARDGNRVECVLPGSEHDWRLFVERPNSAWGETTIIFRPYAVAARKLTDVLAQYE